jgi:hypothetical protein
VKPSVRSHRPSYNCGHGHVDAAGRIGKQLQHVIFWARVIVPRPEYFPVLSNPLPFGFRLAGVITLRVHVLFGKTRYTSSLHSIN